MRVIAIAMKDEAATLIKSDDKIQFLDSDHLLVITGIGKVNAARALTEAIFHYDVTEVINIGVAGATVPYKVNEVYVVDNAYFHDVDATEFGYEKYQVPGMPSHYQSDPDLMKHVLSKLKLLKADLYTGDEFVTKHKGFTGLIDMEGTALYQVCHTYEIPMISIKIISDIIGNETDLYNEYNMNEAANQIKTIIHTLRGV
jgi:adenosylhomocysteine nucleosidase